MALNTTKLGLSGVNALFKQYYGRDATREELNYWSNKSDAELRPKLIPNSAVQLAKNKPQASTVPVRQTPVAIPTPADIPNYNVTGRSADGKTLMGTPKEQTVTPVAGVHYNAPGTLPNEVTPPPTPEAPAGTQPMTGMSDADKTRIRNFLDTTYPNLTPTERQFLEATFLNSDNYTSGRTVPTTAQIGQWISDAATNAATDINPYYQRISAEELAAYRTQLSNIRDKAQNFQANEENTYAQKLAQTKQQLRAKGLTFSGSAIKNIGQEAAVANTNEGTLQAARRLDYAGNNMALGQEAQKATTAAEQRLGSAPVQGALASVGGLTSPTAGNYNVGALTTPMAGTLGTYGTTGSMASTIEQDRAAAIEKSRQDRLKQYALTIS